LYFLNEYLVYVMACIKFINLVLYLFLWNVLLLLKSCSLCLWNSTLEAVKQTPTQDWINLVCLGYHCFRLLRSDSDPAPRSSRHRLRFVTSVSTLMPIRRWKPKLRGRLRAASLHCARFGAFGGLLPPSVIKTLIVSLVLGYGSATLTQAFQRIFWAVCSPCSTLQNGSYRARRTAAPRWPTFIGFLPLNASSLN